MNPLPDASKKRLTEFLGECWHEIVTNDEGISYNIKCRKCKKLFSEFSEINRTFSPDDWQSLGDLKNKLVEKGMWDKFSFRCEGIWERDNHYVDFDDIAFTLWLINPAIFIPLVDEFLKEKEKP